MTVLEIWPGQDRGEKKKMTSWNPIKHPLRGSLINNNITLSDSGFSIASQEEQTGQVSAPQRGQHLVHR